jgi:predicted Zn-dependent protease
VQIVDDSLVNALAAPGGHIVVFRGLILQAESPEELAGVLAHEIQHVVQQHGLKAILREMPARLVLSSMIGSNPLGGSAVQAAYTLGSLSYQRGDELAADREGVRMLSAAGIPATGMRAFFARADAEEGSDGRLVNYLSTHPSNAARLAALDTEIAAAPAAGEAVLTPEEWAVLQRACTRD